MVKEFYSQIGKLISIPQITSISLQPRQIKLVIILNDKPNTGFLFANQKNTNEFEILDPDERPCRFCLESSDLFNQSLSISQDLIPILRSSCIEKTKEFYANFGKLHEEKHGSGPKHYSIKWPGPFTEIYPQGKILKRNVNFIFQVTNLLDTFEELKSKAFEPIFDPSHLLIYDPDGREIKFLKN